MGSTSAACPKAAAPADKAAPQLPGPRPDSLQGPRAPTRHTPFSGPWALAPSLLTLEVRLPAGTARRLPRRVPTSALCFTPPGQGAREPSLSSSPAHRLSASLCPQGSAWAGTCSSSARPLCSAPAHAASSLTRALPPPSTHVSCSVPGISGTEAQPLAALLSRGSRLHLGDGIDGAAARARPDEHRVALPPASGLGGAPTKDENTHSSANEHIGCGFGDCELDAGV